MSSNVSTQPFFLKADNEQESAQNGLHCFINITRSGIEVLKRTQAFKAISFAVFPFAPVSDNALWAQKVSDLLTSEKLEEAKANATSSFFISDSKAIIIPEPIFSSEHRNAHFEFLYGNTTALQITEQPLTQCDAVGVFGVPQDIADVIGQPFQSGYITWVNQLETQQHKTQINVALEAHQFALIIKKKGQLTYANWFDYANASDVLYFLMAALESLHILHSEVEISLSGRIAKNDEVYRHIAKYVSKLGFAKRPTNLTYAYSFQQLATHQYPFIFAAACV